MNKISANQGKIYFLDFTFNPVLRTLQHNDEVLQLRKKQSDVLALLCAKYPAPVSRDEFLEEVWHGGYVTSQSIAQMIRSLRVSLGDESKSIIVTIPKLGYQLTACPCWEEPEPEQDNNRFEGSSSGSIELNNISDSIQPVNNIKLSCSRSAMAVIPCSVSGTPHPTRKAFVPRAWFVSVLAAIFFSLICVAMSARSNPLESIKQNKDLYLRALTGVVPEVSKPFFFIKKVLSGR